MYSPTMSRTFSTNSRSLEWLKVCAIVRVLQCVALAGTLSSVLAITASTRESSIVRGAPVEGASRSPSQAILDESCARLRDGLRRDTLAARHHLVVDAFGTAQNDASPQRLRLRGLAPQRQRRELLMLGIRQHQFCLGSSSHRRLVVCTRYTMERRCVDWFNELLTHDTSLLSCGISEAPVRVAPIPRRARLRAIGHRAPMHPW